jgi:multisubunit Na+/H+ antiporter MnhE subunit
MKPLGTFFFLLAFWLLSLSSFAQKNSILGTIVDEKKQPSLVFPCT